MVVFWPSWCGPDVIQVYSTVALTASLTSMFQYDFNVGSFAQFGDPNQVAHLNERTDFHNIPHFAIRQRLDQENFTDPFILIDEHTAQSHAIWWITTTEESELMTDSFTSYGYPPITYPGENLILWQAHILIQDLAWDYGAISIGETSVEDIMPGQRVYPYDPHDPQEPPFTLGRDYANKQVLRSLYPSHSINATFPEIMYTTDPTITRYKGTPPPPGCVALTPEAATLSGMVSGENGGIHSWWPWHGAPPRTGDVIQLTADYDVDSPRWPPPGVAGEFPGPTGHLDSGGGETWAYVLVEEHNTSWHDE
ncbi:MAG: hypothetical protein Q9224_006538 [Gallowayella concinna]